MKDDWDDDLDDPTACNTPTADWWLNHADPKHLAEFKRHPMTLAFHPELYKPGEQAQIKAELVAAGSPTSVASVFPNVGEIKETKMATQTTVTRELHRGKACVYFDPRGNAYDALITEVWGPQCVNLVYVNDVAGQTDSYGQKLLRATSLMHGSVQQAHGNYWMLPGETRTAPPQVTDSAAA